METTSIEPTAPAPGPTADIRCSRCGYDLKGLDPSSNCPECGQSIALTLSLALEHADRDWLRRQARTMFLLIAVALVDYQSPWGYGLGYSMYYLGLGFRVIATAVAIWACWRLATPDPHRADVEEQGSLGRGLRAASVVYGMGLFVLFRNLMWDVLPDNLWILLFYLWLGAMLLTTWLASLILFRLARRAGAPSLVAHGRFVLWALPLSKAGVYLITLLMVTDWDRGFVTVVITVVGWAAAICTLVSVAFLGRMYEHLVRAAGDHAR